MGCSARLTAAQTAGALPCLCKNPKTKFPSGATFVWEAVLKQIDSPQDPIDPGLSEQLLQPWFQTTACIPHILLPVHL